MDDKENPRVDLKNKTIELKDSDNRKDVLIKDCVFLCENIYFGEGEGVDIDDEILNLLKKAQPEKEEIDDYAIFGRQINGNAEGLRGSWLEINNEKIVMGIIEKIKDV